MVVFPREDYVQYTKDLFVQLPFSAEENESTEGQMGQRLARTGRFVSVFLLWSFILSLYLRLCDILTGSDIEICEMSIQKYQGQNRVNWFS